MKKYRRYLALLLLLGGILSVTFLLAFSNDEDANDYVNVIPETLNVQEGDVFDLAIDSNLDLSVLNIVSSNLSTVRLEGSQLKALSGGTAFITVQTQDGRVQDQVLITVNPLVINEPVEDPSFEIIVGNDRFTFSEPITISQLDAPLREGFTFIGFSLEENGEVLEDDAVIDESLTLYSIYQAVEEETPKPPVVEDDLEDEDEADEDSETPIDEKDEHVIGSTPSSITVTLENDQGITMSVLIVSPGSLISEEDFDTDLAEVGYFIKGETCENPFDFDTPLVTDTSIVFGETNYTSPCIELDEMATLGKLQVGETIQAFVSPSAATITYEWFISVNDRDYSLIRNVTGSTLELAPEHFRQYIAVKLTGKGDYTGSLSLPLGRVGLNSQTIDSGDSGDSGGGSCATFTEINSTNDFSNMTSDGCYKLTTDIDLSGLGTLNQSALDFVFTGTLDGDNYTIENLTISSTGIDIGLFLKLEGATIKNVTLSAFNITGSSRVGGIAGWSVDSETSNINLINSKFISKSNFNPIGSLIGFSFRTELKNIQMTNVTVSGIANNVGGLVGYSTFGSTIDNSHVSNVNVMGAGQVGGLIGQSQSNSEISNSSFDGTVSGSSGYIGGLVGDSDETNISKSSFEGTVSGSSRVGGLVGNSEDSEISNSTFDGTVSGSSSYVGGLIGYGTNSNIINSSSAGDISGISEIGGLVGRLKDNSMIENSFNTGSVTATGNFSAGIAGNMENGGNKIVNSYNTGNVSSSSNYVGGITGRIASYNAPDEIINSYSAGNITGSNYVGGIVGQIINTTNSVTFTAVFWNTDIGSISNNIGETKAGALTTGSITGITHGAMQDIDTFNASWDIGSSTDDEKTWTIGDTGDQATYPWLTWTGEPGDSVKYDPQIATLIASGYIPLSSPEDFLQITNSSVDYTFAAGTQYELLTRGGMTKNYVLINDLDFQNFEVFDTSVIENPTYGTFFTGNISGVSYSIKNVRIDSNSGKVGLFEDIRGNINALTLDSFVITGGPNAGSGTSEGVGALAGSAWK